MFVQVDNLLAVASVSFSEGFSSSLADCWETAVSGFIATCNLIIGVIKNITYYYFLDCFFFFPSSSFFGFFILFLILCCLLSVHFCNLPSYLVC